MFIPQTISIGPFTVPRAVLFGAIALGAGYIFLLIVFRKHKLVRKNVVDCGFNALLIFFAAWKLSPLIFRFSTVLESPLALVYLPGGLKGVILGFTAVAVYVAVIIVKKKLPISLLLRLAGAGVITVGLFIILGLIPMSPVASEIPGGGPPGSTGEHSAQVGTPAPDFTLTAVNGDNCSLSSFRGKIVVINFWATWCPPCRAEMPELAAFYRETTEQSGGPVLLAVNLTAQEKSVEAVSNFIEKENIPFPVCLDRNSAVSDLYTIVSIPTTIIVGADGTILAKKSGAVTLDWLVRNTRER
jgi:peroxiredoxin